MAVPFSVSLTPAQVQELEYARDHHALAYVRVKAAGILKVKQGHSLRQVAKSGLLKPTRRRRLPRCKRWCIVVHASTICHAVVGGRPTYARSSRGCDR